MNSLAKMMLGFFRWFCRADYAEDIEGDLMERYHIWLMRGSSFGAGMRFTWEVIKLLRPGIVRGFPKRRGGHLMGHYLLISRRNLLKHRTYFLVNLLGLSLGMGVALVIAQYLHFEYSFDRFHEQSEHIHRILYDRVVSGEAQSADPYIPYTVGPAAFEQIPEVISFTRLHVPDERIVVQNRATRSIFNIPGGDLYWVDDKFLDLFNFPLVQGRREGVFDDHFNIVLTASTAQRFFGNASAIGKQLEVEGGGKSGVYTVTAVVEDPPVASQLQFQMLLPVENFLEYGNLGAIKRHTHCALPWFATYIQLNENADPAKVQAAIQKLIISNKGSWNPEANIVEQARLQPLTDIHLSAEQYENTDFITNGSRHADLQFIALIAVFVLVIAWVNFVNMATASSLTRAKEVGIRKSVGAARRQVLQQFLVEALLLNLVAAVLALALAFPATTWLGRLMGKSLTLGLLGEPVFWGYFLAILALGSLASGLYPSWILSRFGAIGLLGHRSGGKGQMVFRRFLIVFQFLISMFLVSGTFLIYRQITFLRSQELGMNLDRVLVVRGPRVFGGPKLTSYAQLPAFKKRSISMFDAFRDEIDGNTAIKEMGGSNVVPGEVFNTLHNYIRIWGRPEDENLTARRMNVSAGFTAAYDLEFVAGGPFTQEMVDGRAVILNRQAVEDFGLGTPEEALKHRIVRGPNSIPIVGVVENFAWQSRKSEPSPWLLNYNASTPAFFSFRIQGDRIPESIALIEQTFNQYYPDNPFDYFFADDTFNRLYQADLQFGRVFLGCAAIAIVIACIGLYALTSFSANTRTKEIGIRKVLGAGLRNLMLLLSKEYLMLLGIAVAFGVPLTFLWGRNWLEGYATRVNLEIGIFLIPMLLLMAIALFTVSYQTFITASANPVDSLRDE